jgi:hypothetical protein
MTAALPGHGLQAREPNASIPRAVLEAAARSGSRRQPADPLLLRRVLDGLRRLPGSFPAGGCSPAVPDRMPVVLAVKGTRSGT